MIVRTVYQCEHCKKFKKKPKIYFSKDDMYHHECGCFYNIENKTCFTCKNKNRIWNQINDLNLGCNLNLLEIQQGQTVSMLIKRHCDSWELNR